MISILSLEKLVMVDKYIQLVEYGNKVSNMIVDWFIDFYNAENTNYNIIREIETKLLPQRIGDERMGRIISLTFRLIESEYRIINEKINEEEIKTIVAFTTGFIFGFINNYFLIDSIRSFTIYIYDYMYAKWLKNYKLFVNSKISDFSNNMLFYALNKYYPNLHQQLITGRYRDSYNWVYHLCKILEKILTWHYKYCGNKQTKKSRAAWSKHTETAIENCYNRLMNLLVEFHVNYHKYQNFNNIHKICLSIFTEFRILYTIFTIYMNSIKKCRTYVSYRNTIAIDEAQLKFIIEFFIDKILVFAQLLNKVRIKNMSYSSVVINDIINCIAFSLNILLDSITGYNNDIFIPYYYGNKKYKESIVEIIYFLVPKLKESPKSNSWSSLHQSVFQTIMYNKNEKLSQEAMDRLVKVLNEYKSDIIQYISNHQCIRVIK